jgi:RimJ/RimL family protein N-acetyltransferase
VTSPYWPLSGLRVRTPDLELRWPLQADLDALAGLAAEGVHDAGVQPFTVPWTDAPPGGRARSVLQYHWSQWASWQPPDWTLDLVAERAGAIVGTQGLTGQDFAVRREVSTGSWVGRRFQGQGIGTQMRAAVLHLAFEGLGAQSATSGAYQDNRASLAVSGKLGYADDGIERHTVRGQLAVLRRLRLDRPAWQAHRRVPVQIEGLAPCLPDFGLTP